MLPFVGSEVQLVFSQNPAAGPYPRAHYASPSPFIKILFNVTPGMHQSQEPGHMGDYILYAGA